VKKRWAENPASFERNRDAPIVPHPHVSEEKGLLHTALVKIGQIVRISPRVNGNETALRGSS
jgi:hypothetical protein